jgi:hypothetical protein
VLPGAAELWRRRAARFILVIARSGSTSPAPACTTLLLPSYYPYAEIGTPSVRPGVQRTAREHGSIVGDDHRREPARLVQLLANLDDGVKAARKTIGKLCSNEFWLAGGEERQCVCDAP